MITAHSLELRAGARILLEPTTLRVQAGDRIGLVGRNGAGKTTSLRVLAGETLPHSGSLEVTGPVGYLPQDPRDGDLSVLARDRVLSARGLDTLTSDLAKVEHPARRAAQRRGSAAALRQSRGALLGTGRVRRRERGGAYLREPRPARSRAGPTAVDAVRRPAPARRTRAHPVRRFRCGADDVAARRAHEPPGRRLHHLVARLPAPAHRWPGAHQPRRVVARGRRQQGLVSRREPLGRRRLQRRLEGLPHAARGRREASRARTCERRAQDRSVEDAGRQDAREGHQGTGGPPDGPPRSSTGGRVVRGAGVRPGRPVAVPGARAVRPDAADRRGPVEVLRLARGLRRGRSRHRPWRPGRRAGPQRCGQDDPAAAARRCRGARHRGGRARPRVARRVLRAGTRDARPRSHRAGEHADVGDDGRALGSHRHRPAQDPRRVPVHR